MENLTTFQASQVNDVFKNLELLSRQPNKKVYSKPYLFCEKFVPQEFVAGCDVPKLTYMKVSIGAFEIDKIEGWSLGDSNSYNGSQDYLFFNSVEKFGNYNYKTITSNTYANDSQNGTYYEFHLTSPGILVHYNGDKYERIQTFPTGTIFYSIGKSISSNTFLNTNKTVS